MCNAHYTAYPSDILPGYCHNPETISKLTSECLNAPSGIEQALRHYQHGRERRIEDGENGGPDVSTLRRWLNRLSDQVSILHLFLSAQKQFLAPANHRIMVILLVVSLATQLLAKPLAARDNSSPTVPVTDHSNQVNGGVSSQNDLNFYNQEHPP